MSVHYFKKQIIANANVINTHYVNELNKYEGKSYRVFQKCFYGQLR